ncbi:hypothetical protein DFH08DRAFT_837270 [Mycena albidolilacea]|uniref:DUF6534 domain-containing protein n=1 Tax=Mycena albidolilacea TaxID=1033008 RepID=A0AAD7AT82_9AGAR|nr:hypothetical protein DFH08DRAFT_837270 [Mycena albidolilacea]
MGAHNSRLALSCLLAGSWLNTVFFTLEVILCFLYVRRWKLSPVFSYGFALFLVNDSLGTLCVYANMYLTVTLVPAPQWPVPVLLLSTALSALIEQFYMVHRYWIVTKNTVWSAFLLLLSVTHVAIAISSVSLGGPYKEYFVHNGLTMTTIAAIICTVADVLISLSMVWSLSGFEPVSQSTRQLIRSVAMNALATGIVVATVTALAMISLIVKSLNRNIFSLFFVIMGRVYSLTILMNFYQRHKQQQLVATSVHVTGASGPGSGSQFVVESFGFFPTTRGTNEAQSTRRSRETSSSSKSELPPSPRPSRLPALYTPTSRSEAGSDNHTTLRRFGP